MLTERYHGDIFDSINNLLEKNNEDVKTTSYFVNDTPKAEKVRRVTPERVAKRVYQRGTRPDDKSFTKFILGFYDEKEG